MFDPERLNKRMLYIAGVLGGICAVIWGIGEFGIPIIKAIIKAIMNK